MEGTKKGHPIGKVHRKIYNMDLNEINSRTSYNKYHNEKSLSRADQNSQGLNDNLSEKSNSIQTSYQYRKKYNENNTLSSKCTIDCQNNEGLSVSLSDNDNLICPDCINSVLEEEKKKKKREIILIKIIIIQMVFCKIIMVMSKNILKKKEGKENITQMKQ